MIDPRHITVRYPTWDWYVRDIPGMAGAPAWYHYILAGFRELGCRVILDPALDAISETTQPYQYTTIRLECGGKNATAVYDWNDFLGIAPVKCDRYWKIQALPGTIANPIGQTLALLDTWRNLDQIRADAGGEILYDVLCLGRATAFDARVKAARALKARTKWRQLTGVTEYPGRPEIPADVRAERIHRDDYLHAMARSRVVVALPGVGGAWTWRHTESLALGACLVCPESHQLMPGKHMGRWARCREDLADLVDVVASVLEYETHRLAISHAGYEYFRSELTPAAMARRLAVETLEALP